MYKKILVPLDGSELAEYVLPHVEEIARNFGTEEVLLVSVTEPVKVRFSIPDGSGNMPRGQRPITEKIGKKATQAERYLHKIQKKLTAKGINTCNSVLIGDPAGEIALKAEQDGCDLIIMASHGRTGPSRWALGSVADKVFRASRVPVLMVKHPSCSSGV